MKFVIRKRDDKQRNSYSAILLKDKSDPSKLQVTFSERGKDTAEVTGYNYVPDSAAPRQQQVGTLLCDGCSGGD